MQTTIHPHLPCHVMSRDCRVMLYENAVTAVCDDQCITRDNQLIVFTRRKAHVLKQYIRIDSSMNYESNGFQT